MAPQDVSHTRDPAPDAKPNSDSHPTAAIHLHTAIITRHASREYLPTPVPAPALHRALALAAHSPSNSNVQPWRLWLLDGAPLAALKTRLTAVAATGDKPLNIPALPDWARPYRSHVGRVVYGEGWGIARDDEESHRAALLRNFSFFGAPLAGIVCMRDDLSGADSLSVGMWLQSFLLALRAEGLASCAEVSIAGYPEEVREMTGIPGDMEVLCGLAIGFEDPGAKVNGIRPGRMGWEETTVILSG